MPQYAKEDVNAYGVLPVRTWAEGEIALPKTGQTISYQNGDDGDLRLGVAWPSPPFVNNGDGTVTDKLTGLMWEQAPSNTPIAWAQAFTYCNDLTVGDYTDWRMPSIHELESLVNQGGGGFASWLDTQGFTGVLGFGMVWSSTTRAGATGNALYLASP